MDWIALPDAAVRQSIDSATVFAEFQRVQGEARSVAGGMYFKRQGPYEYLVRTSPDNRQQRIGPRTAETEDIHARFIARKSRIEARHKSLRDAVREAERLNKALKVGRVPAIVVALLQALHEAGLAEHFRVVGTHALYAYDSAAGVRITPGALATQDVDLLWDARRRVRFLADMARLDSSLLDVLRRADRSFERKEDQLETAINARGFEVDFLRRQPQDDDPHPFRFSDDEGDLWPVQARRAAVLASAPVFEQVVVATTGAMALMRTVEPRTFVEFKRWMATQPSRPAPRRQRDARQADIVQAMLDDALIAPHEQV